MKKPELAVEAIEYFIQRMKQPEPAVEAVKYLSKTKRVKEPEITVEAVINAKLPPEVLALVFSLLSPSDLVTVVLVCRWWREVAVAPTVWTWVTGEAPTLWTSVNEHNLPYMQCVDDS